jgi:hypothetical protein
MAQKRKLVWTKKSSFEGWACSACAWLRPNPILATGSKTPAQDVQDAFDAHVCANHPGAQRPHEGLNQTAAKIVREEKREETEE